MMKRTGGGAARRQRAGFSLLESLFTMAILTIVSGAVFTLFYSNHFAAVVSGDESQAQTEAQASLRRITTDLLPSNGCATPANSGGLRVTYSSGSPVEYYRSGTELRRLEAATGITTPVATGVLGWSRVYLNSSMGQTTDSSIARAVDVTITVKRGHTRFGQVTRTTRVLLRNKRS